MKKCKMKMLLALVCICAAVENNGAASRGEAEATLAPARDVAQWRGIVFGRPAYEYGDLCLVAPEFNLWPWPGVDAAVRRGEPQTFAGAPVYAVQYLLVRGVVLGARVHFNPRDFATVLAACERQLGPLPRHGNQPPATAAWRGKNLLVMLTRDYETLTSALEIMADALFTNMLAEIEHEHTRDL